VLDAVAALRGIAEAHIGAVEDLVASYLRRRDGLEPVPATELLERVRDGLVTVIDVRPSEEYTQKHVTGALNIPLDRLEERLKDLPPDREVVAYCRGPLVCAVLRCGRTASGGRIPRPALAGPAAEMAAGGVAGGQRLIHCRNLTDRPASIIYARSRQPLTRRPRPWKPSPLSTSRPPA
jgi:hypothetical protein